MAKLDNPAGRLHELFQSYDACRSDNFTVVDTWARVFGLEGVEAGLVKIAAVAGLVAEIEASLLRADEPEQIAVFAKFGPLWMNNIIQPGYNIIQQPSGGLPIDSTALAVLGAVSSYLSAVASEGVVPAEAEVVSLHQQVTTLIDDIIHDETLPEDFKRLALEHAYRLSHALDDFRIGGPGAVKAATERLLGAMVMASPAVRESAKKTGVLELFGKAYTFVTKRGPEMANALQAWATLLQLPGGSDS